MDKSNIIAAFIGSGVTLVGVIAANFFSKRRSRHQAAAEFRNTFLPEILYLRDDVRAVDDSRSGRVNEFLYAAIFKHLEAMGRFKHLLGEMGQKQLRISWDEYCHPEGIPSDQYEKRDFRFDDYDHIERSKGREEAKKVALQKIGKILEFADFR